MVISEGDTVNITCTTSQFSMVQALRLRRSVISPGDVMSVARNRNPIYFPIYEGRINCLWSDTQVTVSIASMQTMDSDIYTCQLQKEDFNNEDSNALIIIRAKGFTQQGGSLSQTTESPPRDAGVNVTDCFLVIFIAVFSVFIFLAGVLFIFCIFKIRKNRLYQEPSVYEDMSIARACSISPGTAE
ncbi:UNVERIFIED_CONTAM: hypothetical protein FKN15_052798 [Acipenser sinensis]